MSSENVKISETSPAVQMVVSTFTAQGGFVISEIFFTGTSTAEGKSYSGEYLMNRGLEIPTTHNLDWGKKTNWSSRVLLLESL